MADELHCTTNAMLTGRTVLLVDDDVDVLEGVVRALRKQPYGLLTAKDAKEALDILAANSVDLIVSDEEMPGMSGTELLARVADSYPDVIRIMLTGHASVPTAMAAINKGQVFRFFTKPCDSIDLGITIRKALEYKDVIEENRELQRLRKTQLKEVERARGQIEQQTRELQAVDQLNLARLKAERSSAAKSQFIANMTHEFRTPMNAILGFSRLLMRESLTVEQQEQVKFVHESACALLDLVENVLDFSAVEAGELKLHQENFEPERIVSSVAEMTRALVHNKDIAVHADVDHAVPRLLHGDAGRLRQVLVNLVGNAAKFTDRGTIDIRATVESQTDTTVTLKFLVVDSGIGIAGDLQHVIFEDFTQGDGSATRKYGGTGLGLAICKRLAELLGGHIGVESEVGQGSRFWFTAVLQTVHGEPPPSSDGSKQNLEQRHDTTIRAAREDDWSPSGEHDGPAGEGSTNSGFDSWQGLVRAVITSCEAADDDTVGDIEKCAQVLRVWAKENEMDDLSLVAFRVELAARRGNLDAARLATQDLASALAATSASAAPS